MLNSSTEALRERVTVETRADIDVRDRAITAKPRGPLLEDILAHVALLVIAFVVLFPILWVVSMALDPRNISRPTSLDLIPRGATLDAFRRVLSESQANNVKFATMLKNSLMVAVSVSVAVTLLAVTAAYAFARMRFPGRKW